MSYNRSLSAVVGILLCGVAAFGCASAVAAPIVIDLRVEGSTRTLFEGPVSTEAIPPSPGIETKSSTGSHPCDVKDNGANEGFGNAASTPTAALYDATVAQHLAFDATWSASLNDFDISQVGEDIANSDENDEYWGYAVNYTTAGVGGCQFQLAPGSEVLWAYNYFGLSHLLRLSGPTSVDARVPFTVHVVDGQTGQPIADAAIGQLVAGITTTSESSLTTDASGNATLILAQAGTETLKATQSESVRSNGLVVCIHNGDDGTCGTIAANGNSTVTSTSPNTTSSRPEVARTGGVKDGHVYSRHSAPRILEGSVEVPAGSTLREVRISLERISHGHCFAFNGRRAAFTRIGCHTLHFFNVAHSISFSYLLPSRLPAGRYVYAVEAISDDDDVTTLSDGVSLVVFDVK